MTRLVLEVAAVLTAFAYGYVVGCGGFKSAFAKLAA